MARSGASMQGLHILELRTDRREQAAPPDGIGLAVVGVFLFCISAVMAAYYFIGPFGSDDLQYVQLANGGASHLGTARYAVSAVYALFVAHSSIQAAAYGFFLYSFLLALATYWIARRFLSQKVAVSAAVLVACNPVVFYYSAAILPDNALALFFWLHVGLFAIYVWRSRNALHAACSGAALAACYATKEASLVFALPTVVLGGWLLLTQTTRVARGVAAFVAGFVVVLIADMVASAMLHGDPIYRLNYMLDRDVVGSAEQFMATQGTLPQQRFAYIVQRMLAYWPGPALTAHGLALLLLPALAWRWYRPLSGPAAYVAASGLAVVAYLTWGSVSLSHYVGVPLQVRYYAPAVAPAAVALAAIVWAVVDRAKPARVASVAGIAVIVLVIVPQMLRPAPHAGNAYRAREVVAIGRAIAVAKASYPALPVIGDTYVSGRYVQYGEQMGALPWSSRESQPGGEFVLVTANSNPAAAAELDLLQRCGADIVEIGADGDLRLPRNRNSDIGLLVGAASRVRFEPDARVRLHVVHGLRRGCGA